MSAVISHPHRAVDWQAVAIFLAGVMVVVGLSILLYRCRSSARTRRGR